MSNANKSKTKVKLTVQEFQTWLQGIMEFQDSDWSPNPEQWNAIFDKIMNLKVEEGVSTSNISAASLKKIEEILKKNITSNSIYDSYQQEQYQMTRTPSAPLLAPEPTTNQTPMQPIPLVTSEEFTQLTPEEFQQKLEAAKSEQAVNVMKTPTSPKSFI